MLKMMKETSSQAAVGITVLRSKNERRYYRGTKRNLETVLTTNERGRGGEMLKTINGNYNKRILI